MIESKAMTNGCCTNALCADRDTQLRLARLREELLTNFNTLLVDRIRFLEHTINQLALSPPSIPTATTSASEHTSAIPIPTAEHHLSTPSVLRRSSSTTAYFLQSPLNQYVPGNVEGARSCPSSVDLTSSNDRRRRFFSSSKKFMHFQTRTSTESNTNYLSIPLETQLATFTNELGSNMNVSNEKGRLESRRFACDVDDNEVRAFKAMVYMEQARKQHARPLTRLRQALGISTNSNTGNYVPNISKKHSNA